MIVRRSLLGNTKNKFSLYTVVQHCRFAAPYRLEITELEPRGENFAERGPLSTAGGSPTNTQKKDEN